MAQAGYTPIQLYLSTTASAVPSAGNLANGELAINITDGKLFYKDNGGVVQVLATKGAGTIGGSTTQVQYNNAGALAGSANLTFNGTTLTANTLNLTNALGTAYGGTGLTSFTANGVLYASGTGTLATGSALTFDGTNLGVNTYGGSSVYKITFNNNGSQLAGINYVTSSPVAYVDYYSLGTAGTWQGSHRFYTSNNSATPVLAYTIDSSGNSIWSPGGSEQARLNSTGFGVGQSNPTAKLQIKGGTTIANLGDWNSKSNSMFELANPAVRFGIGYDSSDQVLLQAFDSSNNARLLCLQGYGGNVGIGSNAVPSVGSTVVLGVGGANGGTLAVLQSGSIVYRTSASTSGVDFFCPNNVPLIWYQSGSEGMRLNATGLGIGTSSPDKQLDVSGTSASTTTVGVGISVENLSFTNNTRAGIVFRNGDNYGSSIWSPRTGSSAGALVFGTNGGAGVAETNIVEQARIDNSGNWLVGTTSQVQGLGASISTDGRNSSCVLNIKAHNGAGFDPILYMEAPGVIGSFLWTSRANAQLRISAGTQSNGVSLASGGTSWGSFSDARMKEIIEPITDAAQKVLSLRAVIGRYKTDEIGKRRAFLIAQDVQSVLPEAVYQNSKNDDTLNLAYTDVIPLLVAAIKEQQVLIGQLTQRLAAAGIA